MALLDLKTDLKSLKFESGLNRKPFVVKDIDQEGGANNAIQTQGILAAKRIDDVVRMAKLVVAKPGLTYAAKNALSGLIGSIDTRGNFEQNGKLGKELLQKAKDILLTAVTNTAQVPLNGLGLHMYKGNLQFDKDLRDYVSRTYGNNKGDATKRLLNPAHSSQASQGIKKSKKLTLADDKKFGKIDYTKPPTNALSTSDPINSEPIYRKEEADFNDKFQMIPFGFSIYDQPTPLNVRFRAYLDSFSDNFTGNWAQTKYLGRAESFKTYEGFDRQINIGFKIAAQTRADLNVLYRKINLLASVTAPSYSADGIFMKGSWVRMTVGDYLSKVPCTIGSVGFSWQQDYPWEIKVNADKEKDVIIVPHVLDVTLTAAVDHDFVPQTGVMPYIGPANDKEFIDMQDGEPEEIQSAAQASLSSFQFKPKPLPTLKWPPGGGF